MDGILDDMSRSTAAARLTYEDLLKLPDDDKRHELIDGVHYVMSSPVLRHQRVVSRLGLSIGNYVNATGCGEVFFVAGGVVPSPEPPARAGLGLLFRERTPPP